jgi:hypothetical protein
MIGGTLHARIFLKISTSVLPSNSRSPDSVSHSTLPTQNRSDCGVFDLPNETSGAR